MKTPSTTSVARIVGAPAVFSQNRIYEWESVDHWDADLFAVGIVNRDERLRVSSMTFSWDQLISCEIFFIAELRLNCPARCEKP